MPLTGVNADRGTCPSRSILPDMEDEIRGVGESKLKGREGGWGRDEDALVAALQWINLEADVE